MGSREAALAAAAAHLDSGAFEAELARRVAIRSASQEADAGPALQAYLTEELVPTLAALGFTHTIHANPVPGGGPFLIATRVEDPTRPTVLMYGHGDVIRGQDASWTRGAGPWTLARDGDRLYGRGTADNKGQHSVNLAALAQVLAARGGRLGFNLTWLFETSEETGSPGLATFCTAQREALRADVLIASDGPRLTAPMPTVFLGSRGVVNFDLKLTLRDGAHHSGNWGGLLRNPGTVLANAIASLVDGQGRIRIAALRPPPIPANVRAALAGLDVGGGPDDPVVDTDWGEPGLTPAERVFGWNTLEVLAFATGNPAHPVNAIPPSAQATLHLRFVVGTDVSRMAEVVDAHLRAQGLPPFEITVGEVMAATRLDPDDPWVHFTLEAIARTTGSKPVLLPNLGGSLPNDVFAHILGLPTVWIPHSYPGCRQHAPDEHLLRPVAREALQIMAGLFWDLADFNPPARRPASSAAA
ncbi:M20 family metallopeptidase [Rubrivivax albus]|uniref:M20 peptidase family dipeptidase n=1 Tax=Rubrivivax albus TaxID=2499835 RepID=A0A3S2TM72_9BURK|nr:M20 family metallopeptidase [Rubrivivax albus]RVT51532.1 M20 peptidase family dipeptidase [Rubrivivax albus]